MAKLINRLTAREVSTISAPGLHADGGGLYLRVDPSGAKRWTFVFRYGGKRKEMGLGAVLSVALADARKAAQEAREQVRAGHNPIEARARARARQTDQSFGAVADQLIADLSPQWKSAVHRRQWQTTLTVDAAALRPLAVSAIGTEDVLAVLKPIWQAKPETARKLRGRIELVLDAAKARHLRSGENPARWRGHLALLLPKPGKLMRGHHRALAIEDMPAFMADLRRPPGQRTAVVRLALEFTILTAVRTAVTTAAQGREFDLARGIWTVPAARMKSGKAFRIPLSARALAIAREQIRGDGDYLFPGLKPGQPLSNMAMLEFLQEDMARPVTVHGFRSTFKDWATDHTNFQRQIIEEAMAHKVGDDAEQAYRRRDALDKRRRLMEAWAGFCGGEAGGAVVRLAV